MIGRTDRAIHVGLVAAPQSNPPTAKNQAVNGTSAYAKQRYQGRSRTNDSQVRHSCDMDS
jgi:hypothetical protein